MIDNSKISRYQRIFGEIGTYREPRKKWSRVRSETRFDFIDWDNFKDKVVIDIGCNNGAFCFKAKEMGAKRVIGVDKSNCIQEAIKIAKERNIDVEFWQVDVDSKEFRNFFPMVDIVILFSMIAWVKEPEELLKIIDLKTKYGMYFETNASKKDVPQIEVVKANTSFTNYSYFGRTDGYHDMWRCLRERCERTTNYFELPVVFVPLDKIDEPDFLYKSQPGSDKWNEIKESIKEFGIRNPMVLKRNGDRFKVKMGHHRYYILKELGYNYIPAKII
jgi:SAM-dependent methyltransferase